MRCLRYFLPSVILVCSFAFSPAGGAAEAAFPSKPIRFVVPFPAGGSNDIFARLVGERLSERFGQPVVIDNRAGATTMIGSSIVAKAPPDGHTILIISPSFTANAAVRPKLPFDAIKDFVPVSLVGAGAFVLVVHPSVQATTVREFIELARRRSGELTYASAGTGGIGHLGMELFNVMAETKMLHVPYRGNVPALADVAGGRVHAMLPSLLTAINHVKQNRMRALAVSTATRSPFMPELPTIAESGLPGFAVDVWWGILAPAGTPGKIIDTLNRQINAALDSQQVKKALAAEGAEPRPMAPAQFGKLMREEIERWRSVVRARNITPES